MIKHASILLALAAIISCHDVQKSKQHSDDPFTLMDRLVQYVFPARVKVFPWHDIFQENPFEDPKLILNRNKCEIDLYVKRFDPEDLRVKVKNRFVIVEGRKKGSGEEMFMVNRFVQNFALPPSCKEDEVTAVYENGILSVSAPKHDLPPPPPERNIPIEVRKPVAIETTTEKKVEEEMKEVVTTSTVLPLEQLEEEATTTHGKIRKKELKTNTKVTKDNEVTKGEGNGLDYGTVDDFE